MKQVIVLIGLLSFGPATLAASFTVGEKDYKFPASVDPDVLADNPTELWARVYWPGTESTVADGAHPLAVFLHGNHSTCGRGENPRTDDSNQYTYSGTCPSGYVPTPNHRGYDHIARALAADGFVVVSINANRGINGGSGSDQDWGLNMARGRLVLKHLEKLSNWNLNGGSDQTLGVDLKNHLDFTRVGLMGHSRGGEGVLAAQNFFTDQNSPWPARIPNLKIKAIFELAPVDGQTARTFDAVGVPWVVLLPRCDGDVSDLQGIRVFDRAFRRKTEALRFPKSTFYVFGANHNFFNTEWQSSDSSGCENNEPQLWGEGDWQSERQQKIGLDAVKGFMTRYVVDGTGPRDAALFDPAFPMPEDLAAITSFARDYLDTPDAGQTIRLLDTDDANVLQDVTATAAQVTKSASNSPSGSGRTVLRFGGQAANSKVKLKVQHGTPVSFAGVRSVDFSVRSSEAVPALKVKLTFADGTTTQAVDFKDHAKYAPAPNSALSTVRIPVAAFGDVTKPVAGIELTYTTSLSDFELSTIRAAKGLVSDDLPVVAVDQPLLPAMVPATVRTTRVQGAIVARHFPEEEDADAPVLVTVESPEGFPTRAEVPRLVIGGKEFLVSRYESSDLHRITFTLKQGQTPPRGVPAEVRYGARNPSLVVDLGEW